MWLNVLKPIFLIDENGDEIEVPVGVYEFKSTTWEMRYNDKWYDIVVDELEADGFIEEI